MVNWLKETFKSTVKIIVVCRARRARERSVITALADALGMELDLNGRTARKHIWGCEVTLGFGFPMIGLEQPYELRDHPVFKVTASMCGVEQERTLKEKPSYKELQNIIEEMCAYLREHVPNDFEQPHVH